MTDASSLAARLRALRPDMTVPPDGSAVVLDLRQGQVVTLSGSAAVLMQALLGGTTDAAALASVPCDAYDVTPERARRDVEGFVEDLAGTLS